MTQVTCKALPQHWNMCFDEAHVLNHGVHNAKILDLTPSEATMLELIYI